MLKVTTEERHYTIKLVDKLPNRGNANWLYGIDAPVIDTFYRWNVFEKQYIEVKLGGVVNVTASEVSFIPTGNTTSTDVQAAIEELQVEIDSALGNTNLGYISSPSQGTVTSDTGTNASIPLADTINAGLMSPSQNDKLSAIEFNAKDDQIASEVPFTPTGNVTSTDVQSAIEEVQAEIDSINSQIPGFPTQSFTAVLDGGKTLGTVSNGDVVPAFNNPDEVLQFLGIELILPTIINNNSVSLSGVPTTALEVGTPISDTLIASLNRGLIDNKNGTPDTFLTGPAISTVFSGTGIDSGSGVINTPALLGSNTFTAIINYSEGTDPYFDSTEASASNLDLFRVAGNVQNSLTISGRYNNFFGYSTNPLLTSSEIINLVNSNLAISKVGLVTGVTASGGNYTYYCYPATYGDLNNVILDGSSPVLGAFTKLADVSVTNQYGIVEFYIVYRSNAVDAFTNNSLAFS